MDRDTPEYDKWRYDILTRDDYTCVLCSSHKNPEAHHIERWIDNPELRLNVKNGVTLCGECHEMGHHEIGLPFAKITTDKLKDYIDKVYSGNREVLKFKSTKVNRKKQYWD